MLLTLKPPEPYNVPSTLQTHPFPLPSLQPEVRAPASFIAMRRALFRLGIEIPSVLCADRTFWWTFAVGQVTWDLDVEQVEVKFADGTVERWNLDTNVCSPPPSLTPDREVKVSLL